MHKAADRIRNVALVGHRGSGKTSLHEALASQAGSSIVLEASSRGPRSRIPIRIEKARQMSISLALSSFRVAGPQGQSPRHDVGARAAVQHVLDDPGSVDTDRITTFTSGWRLRIRSRHVRPSMPGIRMSSSARSGFVWETSGSTCAPLFVSATTSKSVGVLERVLDSRENERVVVGDQDAHTGESLDEASARAIPRPGDEPSAGARALVVAPTPGVRAGIRALLEASGFVVCGEAADGDDRRCRCDPRCDRTSASSTAASAGDGVAALALVKTRAPATAAVLLVARADADELIDALRAGASGYVLESERPRRESGARFRRCGAASRRSRASCSARSPTSSARAGCAGACRSPAARPSS